MYSSIRTKLTITYVVIIFLVILFFNYFLLNMLEQYYLGYQREVLNSAGRLVADFSQRYMVDEGNYVALSSLAEDFSRQVGARVIIVDRNMLVVGDSVRVEGLISSQLDREEIKAARQEGEGYSVQKSPKTSEWVMQVAVPINNGETFRGAVFLSYSLSSIYDILSDIGSMLTYILIFALVMVGILGSFFARKITRPILALTSATKEISRGNLEQNIKITDYDEVGQLTIQFNSMAARLREMTHQLQNTINEVSTERNKLTAILTNMVDGVIAVDAGNKLIMANPVVEKAFGFKAGENMGKGLKEINIHQELEEYFLEVRDSREEISGELEFEQHVFQLNVSPLLSENNKEFLGSVAVLQDITSQKKLEKMQKEFIADVSHELRTPLSSVNLIVKTMLDYDLAKEEGKSFLKDMDTEMERLSSLVEDILSLTRLESLKDRHILRETDINQLFQEVLGRMLPRAERNQLELTWELPQLPKVEINDDQIKQVLINLLDNAIKYTPQGGWIKVEVQDQGEEVLVMVKDTGPGIPQEDQPRVFERFYRVDKTRSRELGGTGLGLAICYEIVTAHGGKIWLDSKTDYGTVFYFTLPKRNRTVEQ